MARYKRTYAGERRTASVGAKLTPSEREALEAEARQAGMGLSELVRELCLRRTRAPAAAPATTAVPRRNPAAVRLADELRAIGNNLNQLARMANQTGAVRSEHTLDQAITELKTTLARVIAL